MVKLYKAYAAAALSGNTVYLGGHVIRKAALNI